MDSPASTCSGNANSWTVASAELRNVSEDHVLNLTPVNGIAPADRLHGKARLYLVALGSSAASEVTDLAKFLREECGVQAEVLPADGAARSGAPCTAQAMDCGHAPRGNGGELS